MALDEQLRTQISQLLENNRVVLFMKGTRSFPQCGFSATIVQILDDLVPKYHTVNVLKEPDLREGIKQFANWPTIPQLYVDGKFVGGCDIVREMYVSGELHGVLGVEAPKSDAPRITLTDAARKAVSEAGQGQQGVLRLGVSSRFEYELSLDEPRKGDFEIDAGGGVKLVIDPMSAKRADGISIDYASANGGGFRIDNPNEPSRVRPLAPADLQAMLERGEPLRLVDVRTPEEYGIARIEGGVLLDATVERELEALDRDTTLVFYCHHGMRSAAAAERFAKHGWKHVFNLEGGIDAWSRDVDPDVQRY
jgi:monothiol glutaredoxin